MARDRYHFPSPTGFGQPAAADIRQVSVTRRGGANEWIATLEYVDENGDSLALNGQTEYTAEGSGGNTPTPAEIVAAAWTKLQADGAIAGDPA